MVVPIASKRFSAGVLVLLLVAAAYAAPEASGDRPAVAGALGISNRPQLFLDDFLVERMIGVKRVIRRPTKHSANPLITQDLAWEKRTIQVYGTVLYEPERNAFRCWYLGSRAPEDVPEYFMCYAESSDGSRWTKPMVAPGEVLGYAKHNIVVPGGHGLCVLRTPDDPDPGRRYKGLGGNTVAFSPDGIHWKMEPFNAAGKNDTGSSVVLWKGKYLAYVRNQHPDPTWPGVMRAVALSTSEDFRHWTPKKTILLTDERDGYPWVQPYGLEVTAHGDQLIGLLPVLYLEKKEGNNVLGVIKVQLTVSRDGVHWHRVADRGIFLEPTPTRNKPAWDGGTIFPSTTLVAKDDLIYVYYTGMTRRHGEGKDASKGIGLATLPADRFVGLVPETAGSPALIQTKCLLATGTDLLVNADVGTADLRVGLVDRAGRRLPDFREESCRLIRHDPLRCRVTWKAAGGERSWRDVPRNVAVAIRFTLQKGSLYSFQIAP
ncbi:MAG: hypothetical protein JXQ73_16070 [Phycisphaerae bacterium]|nr:hypothetical protein [Phycisphaerae bacterium]